MVSDNVTEPPEAVESEEEDLAKQAFMKQVEMIMIDNQYLQKKDCVLLLWVGAYLNDSIYKEKKHFRNRGMLKKITPFLNHVTLQTTHQLYEACKNLQILVAKRKRARGSRLRQDIATMFNEISADDWNSPQEDILLAFTAGFNLYSRGINTTFAGDVSSQETLPENPQKRFEKIRTAIEDLKKYPFFAPESNPSFNFGLLLGIYYFEAQWLQQKVLKTGGLVKTLPTFLRYMNRKQAEVLLYHINKVVFKLASFPPRTQEERSLTGIWLLQANIQLELFGMLTNPRLKLEKANLSLGFLAGFNVVQGLSDKSGFDGEEGKGEESQSETNASKVPIFVSDEDYLEELEKRFLSPGEKVSFLVGILFNKITNDEGKLLGTNNLKKIFIPYFKNLIFENLLLLLSRVIYTFLSIWVKKRSRNQIYDVLPKIWHELLDTYGNLERAISEDEATLAFIQGYDSFSVLYNEIKQS